VLSGKHILITGVVTTESIAYAVARRALELGAEVLLTGFPRDLPRTEAAARQLPGDLEVVAFDATDTDDVARLTDTVGERWGRLDGALHAIAFAPADALSGPLLDARREGIGLAFQTSTVSLASLASVVAKLAPPAGASLVGLDFDSSGAWPVYNWMGVCKAGLESLNRYLARDLGPAGIRVNLVAAGPIHTRAAGGIPGFDTLLDAWATRAPLRWDPSDATPVADAACFLLSDLARAVTGEVLHVDGGYHAMAAPLRRGGP
jgi:enoyl-[acyl-carrier protein] reductase I